MTKRAFAALVVLAAVVTATRRTAEGTDEQTVVLRKTTRPQQSIIHVPPRDAGGNGTACPDGQAWRASDARCVEAFAYYDG